MDQQNQSENLIRGRVLETARKAMGRKLCDRCLGRLFARAGFGLTNQERGRAVRTVMALEIESSEGDKIPILEDISCPLPIHEKVSRVNTPVRKVESSDGWNDPETPSFRKMDDDRHSEESTCWLCEDIFSKVDELASKVSMEAGKWEFDTLLIGCQVDPKTVEREQLLWQECDPPGAEPLKEELNRSIGKRFFETHPEKDHDRSDPDIAFIVDPLYGTVRVQVKPVFLFGRYRKFERGIPQTRWPCRTCKGKGCDKCEGTGRMYRTSVEELIGKYPKELLEAEDFKLHGMGREDIDVLSLGSGRPFILELSKPRKRNFDISHVEEMINRSNEGVIDVKDIRPSNRKEIPRVKEGTSRKSYSANIVVEGGVEEETLKYNISLLAQSPIRQRTPTRVAHRRADKVRKRSVHEIDARVLPDGSALIEMTTDGGLYIKELLHGDEGRTEPSLSSLLGRKVEVRSLDVTGVHYDEG